MSTEPPFPSSFSAGTQPLKAAFSLSWWLLLAAVVFALPSFWALGSLAQEHGLRSIGQIDRWVPCLLLLAALQTGQAFTLRQLPFRAASQWVATLGIVTAMGLTATLAFSFYGQVDHPLVNWLDAGDELVQGTAALWSGVGLVVSLIVTLRAGWLAKA